MDNDIYIILAFKSSSKNFQFDIQTWNKLMILFDISNIISQKEQSTIVISFELKIVNRNFVDCLSFNKLEK